MTDQKSNLGADREQDSGRSLQAVKPYSVEHDGKPGTKDSRDSSAELVGNLKEQEEGLDPRTAKFSSPFYDPFGNLEEEEVEIHAPGEHQGTTIIEAYNSNGARRGS